MHAWVLLAFCFLGCVLLPLPLPLFVIVVVDTRCSGFLVLHIRLCFFSFVQRPTSLLVFRF